MTSSHRHGTGTSAIAGDIDTTVAALASRVSALEAAVKALQPVTPPSGTEVRPGYNVPSLIAAGHTQIVMHAGTYSFGFGATERSDTVSLLPYGDGPVVIDGTGLDPHFVYIDGDLATDDGFEIAGPGVRGDNTSHGIYGHGPSTTGKGMWRLGAIKLVNFLPSNSAVIAFTGAASLTNPYIHGVPGAAVQTYRGTPQVSVSRGRLGGMYETALVYSGTVTFNGTAFTEPTAAWDVRANTARPQLVNCTGTGPNGSVRYFQD